MVIMLKKCQSQGPAAKIQAAVELAVSVSIVVYYWGPNTSGLAVNHAQTTQQSQRII
jgi:hypothetical protein